MYISILNFFFKQKLHFTDVGTEVKWLAPDCTEKRFKTKITHGISHLILSYVFHVGRVVARSLLGKTKRPVVDRWSA